MLKDSAFFALSTSKIFLPVSIWRHCADLTVGLFRAQVATFFVAQEVVGLAGFAFGADVTGCAEWHVFVAVVAYVL